MKKYLFITFVLIVVGTLAACSSLSLSSSSNSSTRTRNALTNTDPSKLTVEAKTGIGILKLEGTEQAISAMEAKELLPLFLAMKMLSTNNNTAVAEITALNAQIKNTLSADQLTSIQNMTFTSADINTLKEQYGLLDVNKSNSIDGTTSSRTGGFGGPPDGGIPGVGGSGGVTTTSKTQATPNAAASALSARKVTGGLNLTFAQPVIDLLKSKISQ